VRKEIITFGAIAIVLAGCSPQQTDTTAAETQVPAPTVTVTLPLGDDQAGRRAFADLRCTACHAVPSEAEFPAPVSANPGPPLDARLASRDVSYLLASIMTPSHAISTNTSAEVRTRIEGVLSPMGDFSRVMTVRQLVDLHAFLRSVK
jgi:hypothetical protein